MRVVLARPVGRGEKSRIGTLFGRWVYSTGATVGGVITAVVIWTCANATSGIVGRQLTIGLACVIGIGGLIQETRGRVRPLPQWNRQVPRRWLAWKWRSIALLAYGVVLGMAVFTKLHHATMYTLLALIILVPSAWTAVGYGILFGVGKGVSVFKSDVRADWMPDIRDFGVPMTVLLVSVGAAAMLTAIALRT